MVADTLHDLLVRLLDDRELAGFATSTVALRAADRVREGLAPTLDAPDLLAGAHAHAIGLAATGAVPSTVDAITDRAVLDLLLRRGLEPREVARITGVPQPALDVRRARAVAVLAAEGGSDIGTAESAYADAPLDRAPTSVRRTVLQALASATPDDRARRTVALRVLGIGVAAATALGALALSTPLIVAERAQTPPRVEAVATDDVPVSSTVAGSLGDRDDEPAVGSGEDATGQDDPLIERLPTGD